MKRALGIVLFVWAVALAASAGDPYATIPAERREGLKTRLSEYVSDNRTRDWSKLYDLASDKGRGKVTRDAFISRMKQAHGVSFANFPDLLEFSPARADKSEDGGFDVYGCAEAQREGTKYRGIAVVHATFERDNCFFTGWSFDGMANGSCKELEKADWEPFTRLRWNQPMEELR